VYGSSRGDTHSVCGDDNNGFIVEWNWGVTGPGQHAIRVFADGVEFAEAAFTVATSGTEFLRGASEAYLVPNFPKTGDEAIIEWEESLQNFVVIGASGTEKCDASYPTVCIPPPPPDLDCGDIPYRNFTVLPPDPHRFDGDGIGCEQ
jgi:hypothetical protein